MLEIKALTCGYQGKFFLQNINLKIDHQELVGIIGPNGSGKTTLLRAITRIIKPQKGGIFLEGKDIWLLPLKEMAQKVAVVSQNLPVDYLTVEEFVLLGRIPHFGRFQFLETKKDVEVTENALKLTGIFSLRNQCLSEISEGERQLAFIARALAQEPKLLLLDEPTAHLDIAHQIEVLNLIKRLNRALGLTVIIVLHDLNLASEYCQRLVLLKGGKVFKNGLPEEVLTYQVIEEVYNTVVVVEKNPLSSRPLVLLVSGDIKKEEYERNHYDNWR